MAVEIPQVDKFYGKFNWKELLQDLGKVYHDELYIERTLTTPQHYAYLKISEGCDRKCSYCAIPIITGRHISKPMEEILDEVRSVSYTHLFSYKYTHCLLNVWYIQQNNSPDIYSQYNTYYPAYSLFQRSDMR